MLSPTMERSRDRPPLAEQVSVSASAEMTVGPAQPDPVDYDAAVRAIEAHDDNLEGIRVFLVLEGADLPAAPRADARGGETRELGAVALGYLAEQLAGRDQATLDDVAMVLKVLGAHHFDAADSGA